MRFAKTMPFGVACFMCAALAAATPAVEEGANPATVAVASPVLRGALHKALDAAAELDATRARRDAAAARAEAAARPLYNPVLGVEAERADVDRDVAELGLTLDLGGKRGARAAQGAAEYERAEAEYAKARRELGVRWLKAWAEAALALRETELADRRVVLMQRFDALANERLELGDISSLERDLAGLALGEAQIQRATLIGREAGARAALFAIGGDASMALPPIPDALPPAADAYAPRAAEELPELLLAHAERDAADAAASVARRARIPDPDITLTGGRVRNGPIHDRVLGLRISIPLPVRNTGSAELRAALAETDAAAAALEASRRGVGAAQAEARIRYAALHEAARAFRGGRAAAFEERTALLERLWRAGEIDTSDYLVQLKQSLDTALGGLELENQVWQAWFDHLAQSGRLDDWIDGRGAGTSP